MSHSDALTETTASQSNGNNFISASNSYLLKELSKLKHELFLARDELSKLKARNMELEAYILNIEDDHEALSAISDPQRHNASSIDEDRSSLEIIDRSYSPSLGIYHFVANNSTEGQTSHQIKLIEPEPVVVNGIIEVTDNVGESLVSSQSLHNSSSMMPQSIDDVNERSVTSPEAGKHLDISQYHIPSNSFHTDFYISR
jgi:hypothetical protein